MAKTILFSDNSLWSCLNFRGYIIDSLIGQGYRVVIVAPNDSFVKVDIPTRAIYEPVEMERTGSNPMKDFGYMMRLRALYKKHKPSLIFHYTIKPNIYGTFAAKMLGIPSVAMVTGLGTVFKEHSVVNKIAQNLYKVSQKFAKTTLVLNAVDYQTLIDNNISTAEKIILLKGGEGVDLNKFSVSPLPLGGKTIFLMIGRVLYDKGYSEFVEAAKIVKAKFSDVEFQLLGSLDEISPLRVACQVVDDDHRSGVINYLGFADKPFEVIEKSTCVVLPSFYNEGLNRSLMEAAAVGRPIITTENQGCRETVDNGVNGYAVPVKDGKALAEACARFIALSPSQKEEMAFNSRQKAQAQFNIKDVLAIYKNLINKLAK